MGSAGADPGPACYGRGGPLAVTDMNFFLGKILPEHFPFPLDREIVERALEATGTLDLRRRSINELSGGQRQRALVAQGLAQQAPVLLLDEPMAGLDRRSQRQLFEIVQAEAARGTTVLLATHDLDEAARADNLIVLACECVCCAPPVTALNDPAVTSLFGTGPRFAVAAQ